jgi:AraC-like DNA-binding protein
MVIAKMPKGVAEQPNWLAVLLQDLDKAASLGLQDTGWLLRHVRLVWERLVFSRGVLDGKRFPQRPVGPRQGRNHAVLAARLNKVRQMLEEHYDRPINLREMAASACVSRFHFLREFRKNYGKTPYQLLLKIRLDAARRMIERESTPINEISRRVGYSSSDGFYRAFRKRFHRSPSECRLVPW